MPKSGFSRIATTAVLLSTVGAAGALGAGAAAADVRPLTVCSYTSAEPELSLGDQGAAVKQAQCELNIAYALYSSTGYGNGGYGGLTIDGVFGNYTWAATEDFQRCEGIAVDGIIGPQTWSRLDDDVATGTPCVDS